MNYAPILINTLCRFELFKKCLESLHKNSLAKKTIVYIALDYPFKNEHWDGYNKIKQFLKNKFSFKKLNIIERKVNFGPHNNMADAIEQVFQKYDRIILSEDDNEFSPNFLEYINKGLEKFENENDVLAINGYMWPHAKLLHNENNFIKQKIWFTAWGYGIWKNRWQKLKTIKFKKYAKKNLYFPKAIFLFLKKTKVFLISIRVLKNEEGRYDDSTSLFMFNENKFIVQPIISKVRNNGYDGSGITSSDKFHKYFCEQVIDDNQTFSFIGKDENIEQNEKKLSKTEINHLTNGFLRIRYNLLKMLVQYIILKIFGVDFLNKLCPPSPWGPKAFAQMRSDYLKQKDKPNA